MISLRPLRLIAGSVGRPGPAGYNRPHSACRQHCRIRSQRPWATQTQAEEMRNCPLPGLVGYEAQTGSWDRPEALPWDHWRSHHSRRVSFDTRSSSLGRRGPVCSADMASCLGAFHRFQSASWTDASGGSRPWARPCHCLRPKAPVIAAVWALSAIVLTLATALSCVMPVGVGMPRIGTLALFIVGARIPAPRSGPR